MAKSIASGQNVEEQNLLKNKSTKRDIIKKSTNTIIDNSEGNIDSKVSNVLDNKNIVNVNNYSNNNEGETNSKKIDIEKLKIEIKEELKEEILEEFKYLYKESIELKKLDKEEFISFLNKDLKRINDINKIEKYLEALMTHEVVESSISGTLPNLKMYLDEFVSFSTRLEKNAYKVNIKLIEYNFSFETKKQILAWIDEVRETLLE